MITTVREAQQFVVAQTRAGKTVGLVPTMGALHAGHLSLVSRSRQECDCTAVSIFVNPTQFAPGGDYQKYPRPLDDDLAMLSESGVDMVFAPSAEEMYPAGFSNYVEVGEIAQPWEGVCRPGHFRGVATVVLKLFQIVPAQRAYFGRKDFQQVLVVKRMVADFNLPIEIVTCPLVRDADGLALSSRNAYLSSDERRAALVLSRSLQAAKEMFAAGQRDAAAIRAAMLRCISQEPEVNVEYVAIANPETLAELSQIAGSAVALIAARVGSTRLIDNELLGR
jgi:pantoate--beta-alanine ligase